MLLEVALMEDWLILSQTPVSFQCDWMLVPQIEKKSVKEEKAFLQLLYTWQCACVLLKKLNSVQVSYIAVW